MRPDRNTRTDDGFTIVELSVVLLLLAVAMAMMFTFLVSATETTARTAANTQSEADAQIVLRTMTSDLRSAYSIDALYPTGTCTAAATSFATPYALSKTCIRLTILRPTVGGELCPKTEVAYGVVGGQLLMDRIVYIGTTASCNPVSTTSKKILLTNVLNSATVPLFTYYDRDGKDLLAASPVASPVGAASVKVTLTKQYRTRNSDVVNFSDVVALRNKR